MRVSAEPLITSQAIAQRVDTLARDICKDYRGQRLVLVCVLKGALPFCADLMRALDLPIELECVRASSYRGTEPGSAFGLTSLITTSLAGKHVLVVEDILDSGQTSKRIVEHLELEQPASVRIASMFDKPSRRAHDIQADYMGFRIDDQFVVGYGLDYNEQYRDLPAIYRLEEIPGLDRQG